MRNFTTFLSLAAALTLSAASNRTFTPSAHSAMVADPMAQTPGQVLQQNIAKGNLNMLGQSQAAQRMSDKTPAARAIQLQLGRLTAASEVNGPAKVLARQDDNENTEVILEENFDLFTNGSEDEIDTSFDYSGYVTDFETGACDPNACDISDEYTQTPGWTGECVYGAGGAVAIYYPGIGGILNTPNTLNLYGVIRVSFRAKSLDTTSSLLFVTPCKGSFANISMAGDDYRFVHVYAEDGWTDFELEFQVPYTGDNAFIQFNGMNYDNGVILDDVKIERVLDKVLSPTSIGTTRYTDDGFTLYWTGDPRADSFLINMWEIVTEEGSASTDFDFEDIEVDENGIVTDFHAPEGWVFDLNTNETQVATNPLNDTQGLYIMGDEERYQSEYWMPSISTPAGALVSALSLDMYVAAENTTELSWDGETYYAPEWLLYGISANGDENFITYGALENVVGDSAHFDLSQVPDLWYGGTEDYTNLYYGIVLYILPSGNGAVIVDDIHYESTGQNIESQIVTDMYTSDCEVTFHDLDMSGEHYFTLQSCLGDYTSPVQSDRIRAFGIKAPVALPATNIDERGEFTANWEPVEGASAYYIHNKMRYTAPNDLVDYAVISDDFDKSELAAQYTMDDPRGYDHYTAYSLDAFTIIPGWVGYGLLVANSVIGIQSDVEDIMYICTPSINFSNAGGEAKIHVKAYGTYGDSLAVMYDGQEESQYVPFNEDGTLDTTFTFTDLEYGCFYFYSGRTGDRIFFDKIEILQDIREGEVVEYNSGIYVIQDGEASSCDFSALEVVPGLNFLYSVYSYAYDNMTGDRYLSESSNDILVDFNTGSLESILGNDVKVSVDGRTINTTEAANIYDLQGRCIAHKVTSATVAPGIYIVKLNNSACKVIAK